MMQFRPLDLPAPVAPAMSRWGVVARFIITARPAMSLPMPTSSGWVAALASGDDRRSPRATRWRWLLGTSTPMAERPGMGARMRTSSGGEGVGDVLVQRRDPGDLDARAQLQLVAGDGGADRHADQPGLHAVGGEGQLQVAAARLDGLAVDGLRRRCARAGWPAGSRHVPFAAPGRGRAPAASAAPLAPGGGGGRVGLRAGGPLPGVGRLLGHVVQAGRRQRLRPAEAARRPRLSAPSAPSPSPPSRSLARVDTSSNLRRAAPRAGWPMVATPRPALRAPLANRVASVRSDDWLARAIPATAAATSRTVAPALASRPRIGSPTMAPIQPPASCTSS